MPPTGWHQRRCFPARAETDADGKLAERFAATTLGAIVVYDATGDLQYQGGITVARGHEGDNRGKAAIFAVAHDKATEAVEYPVYGCPLRSPVATEQSRSEK